MIRREEPRVIPAGHARYFSIRAGKAGTIHFRFPSYTTAAKLLPMLEALRDEQGISVLTNLLDTAGYCIGLCWWDEHRDLEAGSAPAQDKLGLWRGYGEAVIDELQEEGANLGDLVQLTTGLLEEFSRRMGDMEAGLEQRDFSSGASEPASRQPGRLKKGKGKGTQAA